MLQTRSAIEPFSFFSEVDRLFDSIWGDAGRALVSTARPLRRGAYPALNIWEEDGTFFVEAECPGVDISQLDITVTGNELTISGSREEQRPNDAGFLRRERAAGRFRRVVELPVDLDADQVTAELVNGVLTVRLPKAASARLRRIEVRSE